MSDALFVLSVLAAVFIVPVAVGLFCRPPREGILSRRRFIRAFRRALWPVLR